MTARIASLHIYPIKSCAAIDLAESPIDRAGLAGDRRWMILTAQGQFMTQRQWPAMALIRPAITARHLELHAAGMPVLQVPLDDSQLAAVARPVTVWKDTVPARDESAEAAAWISQVLGQDCVLVKLDAQARRPARPEWVERWREGHADLAQAFEGEHAFGFADGFPLLIANQASLDELNARLAAQGQPAVPMNRFRPNIVIQGEWEAYDEDHTAVVSVGPVRMALVKPCTRCPMPNIDQLTAQRHDEPGRTLAAYRQFEIGVVFGQNAIVDAPAGARLRVGDAAEIELDF
ncbi:MOSC domain-containing protein [Bordetella sp. BOR01]|uniref:MOSC domain-containing protein n=1 Tax=Bordetella sp. BOR01 TaxID=2854779 RepID=UPI001C48BE02|nr:MOSC N-terminal beta barrel domain-containing protein [Bordetella sp. BOR01]MBV7482351.1 MOSC N-terminal beta barrel domain-containing protein [Bordetella sp. BOR01]